MELENQSSATAEAEVISGQISKLLVIICHFNSQTCKYMAQINKRLSNACLLLQIGSGFGPISLLQRPEAVNTSGLEKA